VTPEDPREPDVMAAAVVAFAIVGVGAMLLVLAIVALGS
jgi:hypothetical protein